MCAENKVLVGTECVDGWEFIFAIKTNRIGPGGLEEQTILTDTVNPVRARLLESNLLLYLDAEPQQFAMSYFGSGVWQVRIAFTMQQYNTSSNDIGKINDAVVGTQVGNEVFFTELPYLENMPQTRTSHVAFQPQSERFMNTKRSRGFQIVDSSYTPGKYILVLDIGLDAPNGFVLILKKYYPSFLDGDSECEQASHTANSVDLCCHGFLSRRYVTTQEFYEQTSNCSTLGAKTDIAGQNFVQGPLYGFKHSFANALNGKITLHITETDMFNVTMQQSRIDAIEILDLEIGFAFLTSMGVGNFSWNTVLVKHRLEKTLYSTITSQVQSDALLVVGRNVSLFRAFLRHPTATLYDFADVHVYNVAPNSTATYKIEASSVLVGIGTSENTTTMHQTCAKWNAGVGSMFSSGVQASHGDCDYAQNVCIAGHVRAGSGEGMIISLGENALSDALEKSSYKIEAPRYLFLDFYVSVDEAGMFMQKRVRSQHLVSWQRTRVDCANEQKMLGVIGVENILGLYPNVSLGVNVSGFNNTKLVAPVATLQSTVLPPIFLEPGNEDYFVRLHRLFIVHVSGRIKQENFKKIEETTGLLRKAPDSVFELNDELLTLCPYWFVQTDAGTGCQTKVVIHNGVLDPQGDIARELTAAPHAPHGTWDDLLPSFGEHAHKILESQGFDRRLRTAWLISTKNPMNKNMQLSALRAEDDIPSSQLMLIGSFRLHRASDTCPESDYELGMTVNFPLGILSIGHSAHIRTLVRTIYADVLGCPVSCVDMNGFEPCTINGTQRACTTVRVHLPYIHSNISEHWSTQILHAAMDKESSFHLRLQYLTRTYLSDFANTTSWVTGTLAFLHRVRNPGDATKPRNSAAFSYLLKANDVPVSDQAVQFFAKNISFGKNARMTAIKITAPPNILCGSEDAQKRYIKERIESPLILSSSNTLREIVVAHVGISEDLKSFCTSRRRLLQFNIFLLDSEIVFLPVNPDVTVVVTGTAFLYDAGVRYLVSEETQLLPAVDVFRGFGWLTDGSLIPPQKVVVKPKSMLPPKPLWWLLGIAWTAVVVYGVLLLVYVMILSTLLNGHGVGIMDNTYFWEEVSELSQAPCPPENCNSFAYMPVWSHNRWTPEQSFYSQPAL